VPPDLVEDELGEWAAVPLAPGFAIEEVLIAAAGLGEVRAAGGSIAGSALTAVSAAGSRLRSLALTDVIARDCNASNADWTGARMRRVVFERSRMTGVNLSEVDADDVVFRDCKLDLANLRSARIQRTTFEDCLLDEADFSGATLKHVRFTRSQLRGVDLDGARLAGVDLRTSELDNPRGDLKALHGATIDTVQLAALAHLLAARIGIEVDDGQTTRYSAGWEANGVPASTASSARANISGLDQRATLTKRRSASALRCSRVPR
jgi:uncharacterized protein YjbI with pentapeptide repeats